LTSVIMMSVPAANENWAGKGYAKPSEAFLDLATAIGHDA